jgi:hypothetical protein
MQAEIKKRQNANGDDKAAYYESQKAGAATA